MFNQLTDVFDFWRFLAGLGVFLFGMQQMEASLKLLAGKGFKRFLRQTTQHPVLSVFSGMITTAILQSSSLVGLIVLALVGAGIIPLINAIGVIIGSNLGTTFTGWVVATIGFKLNLETAILPMLGIAGLGLVIFKQRLLAASQLLFGLSLLLLGLDLMKESVEALSSIIDIKAISEYPLIVFLIVGVVFTAIIQSSSATMMITLSALNADLIPLPAAASLVIGADLGTTSTVFLGSLQGATSKRRVALSHILFNLTVDTIAFLAIIPLLQLIEILSITDLLYSLVAFHSLFNLFGLLIFLPFLKQFARFLESMIPEQKDHVCYFIDNVPTRVTDLALEALVKECLHLIYNVALLNLRFLSITPDNVPLKNLQFDHYQPNLDHSNRSKIEHYETIKILEGKIVHYSIEIQTQPLDTEAASTIELLLDSIRHAVYSSKSLKDINDNLVYFSEHESKNILEKFREQQNLVREFYNKIFSLLDYHRETELFAEELEAVYTYVDSFYRTYSSDLYSGPENIAFSGEEISTLLNVNKEIHTSCKAFYKAVKRFWIRTSLQNL